MRTLLKGLGFEIDEWDTFGRPYDSKEREHIYNKEVNIQDYTDTRWSIENRGYFFEVIYGKKKVFLLIHTNEDKQSKISKILNPFIKKVSR